MKTRIIVFVIATAIAGVFSYTRPHNAPPADLRDALSSGDALNALKATSRAVEDEVPLPAAAQRVDYTESAGGKVNVGVKNSVCGPDITVPLGDILNRITAAYESWPPEVQEAHCSSMDVDASLSALGGWDIVDLRPDLYKLKDTRLVRGGECHMTVEVDGKCYRHEEVNYVMWGLMTQLCGKSLAWSGFKTRAYLHYFYLSFPNARSFPGEADNKVAWTEAGYYGWPKRSGAPPPMRPDCMISSGPGIDFPPFSAIWQKTRIR